MATTDKLNVVGEALYNYLLSNRSALEIRDVWYATEGGVPRTPAILVEPQVKLRDLQETGFTTVNTFRVAITLLHSRLDSQQKINKEALTMAEDLEIVLHANKRLDGLLVHSYVKSIELGLATRQRVSLKAVRLQWEGLSKSRLR